MNTRERWIVYPLLALALGSSLKFQIIQRATFECRTLVASTIEIVDRDSRRQAVLQSTSKGGELSLLSAKTPAQTTISAGSVRAQNVQIVDLSGRLQGVLTASPNGAVLTLHGQDGREHTILGAGRLQTAAVQATVVQAGLVNSSSIRVSGSDGKPQAALEATTGGVGRLRLVNINDKQVLTLRAPGEPLVPPAKVDDKEPVEKKPEPDKGTEKSAPRS